MELNQTPKVPEAPKVTAQQGLEFKGIWQVELFDAKTGERVLNHIQDNIIVDNAIVYMCEGKGPADFTMLHLGNAPFPTTPVTTDLQLNQDFFQGTTVHTALNSNGVFSFTKKCSLAETDAVGTLTEAGLFTPGGIMLNRILFNPSIVKTNMQTAFITTTIQIRRV